MSVRKARPEDLAAIVALCEDQRRQLESWQPQFHRKASDSAEFQHGFYRTLIDGGNAIVLVYVGDAAVRGVIFGSLRNAPAVYNVGGKLCLVEDFVCKGEDDWPVVGQALLNALNQQAKDRGAAMINITCGPKDVKKRKFLSSAGYSVATEWHVRGIG